MPGYCPQAHYLAQFPQVRDEKIGDFLARLADRVPAPGGGRAAAKSGSIGGCHCPWHIRNGSIPVPLRQEGLMRRARKATSGSRRYRVTYHKLRTTTGDELRSLVLRLADDYAEAFQLAPSPVVLGPVTVGSGPPPRVPCAGGAGG